MGNQTSKQNVYQQYYDLLNQQNGNTASGSSHTNSHTFTNHIPSIKNGEPDPYELFGISKNFTWDELKKAYYRIAMMVHPDKGGSEPLFNFVTDSFKKLATEYQSRESNKPHHVLRKESERYHKSHDLQRQQPNPIMNPPENTSIPGDETFMDRFNRLFEEHRIDDDTTRGYGNMMEPSSKNREDINIPKVFKKFSNEAFHAEFNKLPSKDKIVKYKEPEAMVITKNIAYTEIGKESDNFTHMDPNAKNGLFYTDYMEAHANTRLIDPNTVKRKEFRTVEEYDAYRSKKTQRGITEKERRFQEKEKERLENAELERLERVKRQDELSASQHNKIKQRMLQYQR